MSPRLAQVTIAALALFPALPAAAEPKEVVITMGNMTYGKIPSGIKVGDTIVWVNRDTAIHSATAKDHSFDIRANPGQTIKMTAAKAGTFPFICIYHSMMRGTLTIEP
jgi:plastocyanin